MTEYEAYDALMSLASNSYDLLFGYFSLVFGFLVMSHLAAKKLSDPLVIVVVALYSLACLYMIFNFYALNTDIDSLYAYLLTQKQNGAHGLSWFGQNPLWVPKSMTVLQILLGAGGYFGSIFFFFHRRKESQPSWLTPCFGLHMGGCLWPKPAAGLLNSWEAAIDPKRPDRMTRMRTIDVWMTSQT